MEIIQQRKKLLDLFCCAGGAAMGYYQAGFEVVGVDIKQQKRYPFTFICDDAIDYLIANAHKFDAIHASPPCQHYSQATPIDQKKNHPDLIRQVRFFCRKSKKPYIIENVPAAKKHLIEPVYLCGTMFNLEIVRHRYFESNLKLTSPGKCNHIKKTCRQGYPPERGKEYHCITGNFSDLPYAKEVMQIDWMTQKELAQAIPPAYTKFLGEQLLKHLR